MTSEYIQLCTVGDLTGEECPRLAQYRWDPEPDSDPLFLCRFHYEPFQGGNYFRAGFDVTGVDIARP